MQRTKLIVVCGAFLSVLTLGAQPFEPGSGPVDGDATLEEKVGWLISEVGSSQDGLSIRDSLGITDEIVFKLMEVLAGEPSEEATTNPIETEDLKRDSEATSEEIEQVAVKVEEQLEPEWWENPFIGGGMVAAIIGALGWAWRLSMQVAKLQGMMAANASPNVVES